jgi:hypothetical protein
VSTLAAIKPPKVEGLSIRIDAGGIKLSGTIVMKDPRDLLGGFFKQVHDSAIKDNLGKLVIDVSELTFVNSSSIRLFVDLATWVKTESAAYQLTFRSKRSIAWQRTAFMALQSLAKGVLHIEYAA